MHEIPGWVTARERRHDGRRDKSDAQDAWAAARALQREPGRPLARPEDGATMLRLLADERDALVQERTRLINQVRASVRRSMRPWARWGVPWGRTGSWRSP